MPQPAGVAGDIRIRICISIGSGHKLIFSPAIEDPGTLEIDLSVSDVMMGPYS